MPEQPTNPPKTETPPEFKSIFDGEPEMPAPDAQRVDEGNAAQDPSAPVFTVNERGRLDASIPLGSVDPFDHKSEQDALEKKQKQDGVAPPPLPTDAPTPLRNPAMMANTTDQLHDEMERRFQMEMGETKVKVTSADRDAFVRAALTDCELQFDIVLDGVEATISVAIPPDEFTTSASAAVNLWSRKEHIDKDSDLQWLLAFQQLHAWYQIRAINGEPTPWSDFWVDGIPAMSKVRERMRDYASFDEFFRMHAVRWRMLLDAIRTSELKYKICLQNWKNRSFFTGADTD
jgi:hypothetical protein